MKNQLLLLCLVYSLSGGLVYLNPTEPFNLYLEVGFVAGLFVASPFVFYRLWLLMAPGHGRRASAL
jgi:sec-independent protein translocase protein TatC